MRLPTRLGRVAGLCAVVALAACSRGASSGDASSGVTSSTAATTSLDVPPTTRTSTSTDGAFVLDEWSIRPPTKGLEAGRVKVFAVNEGQEAHELVIVRAADVAALPTRPDGSVDEDGIPEAKKVGEIADVPANQTRAKSFDLPAGAYVAFCNLVDTMGHMGDGDNQNGGMGSGMMGSTPSGGMRHVHYAMGMVTAFTVT